MANSTMKAKQLFAAATAEAALSNNNKLAATFLIMVAENPKKKKQPTRKMHTRGGLNELIHSSVIGKAFAVELLKFNSKWSEPKTFVSRKRKLVDKPHPDLAQEAINDEPMNADSQVAVHQQEAPSNLRPINTYSQGVVHQQEATSNSRPSNSDSQGVGSQQQRETLLAITNWRPSTPAFGSSVD